MRTALISDIHGNYEGLQAVLTDIAQQQCDRIFCLGDLVDGGSQSVEVVRTMREQGIVTVRGNHDESGVWNDTLPEDVRTYLQSLPEEIIENGVIYTHTSPRIKKRKIRESIEAWNVFEETHWRRVFVGDVHIPMILGQRCDQKVSATEYSIVYDEEFAFDPTDRYIVCVGAVGYSRDEYRRLRYAVYDSDKDSLLFKAPAGRILVF
jgi:predicted phosphodiesterase